MVAQRFNIFQRLVRSWEAVHPYNAAQVLTLQGEQADAVTVNAAWRAALARLNLGRVRFRRDVYAFSALNGKSWEYPVRVLPPDSALEDYLNGEMNRPFDDPHEPPFRPFLIPGAGEYRLGVVYRHWVADSVAIRSLLRAWCAELLDWEDRRELKRRRAPGYWALFAAGRGAFSFDQAALGLLRSYVRFRTVRKVCMSGVADYPVRVILETLPNGIAQSLRDKARRMGVTVGDVLLTVLGQACHRQLPLQRRPRRRDIAVGSIVDLRPHSPDSLSDVFGFFLGFSHVICRREDLGNFPRLLRSIHLQNRARRRDGIAQSSLAWMIAASIAQRFGQPNRLYRFYRKEIPLAAGLSNVNLAGSWAQALHPTPLLGYLRISPTGPMAPVALSATTLGSQMSLALTYRPSILEEQEAREMVKKVVEEIVCFCGDEANGG